MNKSMVLNTVISATAGGILGGVVTYLTVKKTFQTRADAEIESVKEQYKLLRKDPETVTTIIGEPNPGDLLGPPTYEQENKISDFVKNYNAINNPGHNEEAAVAEDDETEEMLVEPGNIWDKHGEKQDDRMANYERRPGEPWIVSRQEFEDAPESFSKDSVVYYEGDDTLCDTLDQTVPDIEKTIGRRHLDMFGVLSDDPQIVYVFNEKVDTYFEVALHSGAYSVQVLGLDPEMLGLKEPKRRPQRMRDSDH